MPYSDPGYFGISSSPTPPPDPAAIIVAGGLPEGWAAYANIFQSDEAGNPGNAWDGSGYSPFDEDEWASFAVVATEEPAGTYSCVMPSPSPSGWYVWTFYKQRFGGPELGDPVIAESDHAYRWNGTRFSDTIQGDASDVQSLNAILSQSIGSDRTFTFTVRDGNGLVVTSFSGDETPSCSIWSGQGQAVLASPVASWLVVADGTVQVTVAASDIAALPPGLYRMEGTLASDAAVIRFFDGSINLTSSPGATSASATYCSFDDMKLYAPQIQNLQDTRTDLAGFLGNRARARTWTNESCLDGYRPNFGRARRYVSPDGITAGPHLRWVSSGPAGALTPTIEDLRAAITLGGLSVTDKVREANAHMAVAITYLNQPGRDNPYHALGAQHQATAAGLLRTAVIEIDLDDPLDGTADVRIGQDVTWLT